MFLLVSNFLSFGRFYFLLSELHCQTGNHAEYYRAALHYLGCSDISHLSQEEHKKRAFYLGLAALLGEGIYNFGELVSSSANSFFCSFLLLLSSQIWKIRKRGKKRREKVPLSPPVKFGAHHSKRGKSVTNMTPPSTACFTVRSHPCIPDFLSRYRSISSNQFTLLAILISSIFFHLDFECQLAHPILDALKGSDMEWLMELLYTFNEGNISKFEAMKTQWSTQPDLVAQEMQLREKIRLLCLMEVNASFFI